MIRTKRAHLHVAAATHPGMRGKNNEDRYAVSAYHLSPSDATPSLVAVISDGIGGHRAGEVASEIAVETISNLVANSDAAQPRQVLVGAVMEASRKIHAQAESNLTQAGMGATCVVAWVIGKRLFGVSVGDSRLYLLRGDAIAQLTTDHTWVQEAIDYGALTPEQARKHPNAHVIRRYLGSPNPPEADFRLRLSPSESDVQAEANQGMPLLAGDFLVLCSDGLTDLVSKEEIREALKSSPREKALDDLIDLANSRGGHDNITVIVLEVPEEAEKTHISQRRPPRRRRLYISLALLALTAFMTVTVILAAASLYWYTTRPTPPPATPTAVPTWTTMPLVIPTDTLQPATETPLPATATALPVQATLTPWPTNTLAPPSP